MKQPQMFRRLRVLHVVQNLNYGGMERLIADLARATDRARVDFHVLVLQYLGHFAAGLERVATVHQAAPMPPWSMFKPSALARQIGAIAPDVVHTHSGVWYKTSLAARRAGVPCLVHTEHGRGAPDPWLARRLDGAASARTDVVIAVSASVAAALRERVVHTGCRIVHIANGVDTMRFSPRRADDGVRAELALPATATVLGSVGRLEHVKGYDIMIDAFARLVKGGRRQDVHLVLAGDGSERGLLERRIQSLGLDERVHLLGWRNDLHRLLAAFDCFTMSSRSEGTSVSLLEAMSAARCPIVTDVGGNREVLGAALQHRLVTPGQPDALADAWSAALQEPTLLREDGCRARERVVSAFSLETMVEAYQRIYERAFGDDNSSTIQPLSAVAV